MEDLKLPEDFYHEGNYDYYNHSIDRKKKDNNDKKEENHHHSNEQIMDRSTIVQEALKLSDLIEDTSDNLKKIYYFDKLNKLGKDTIVLKSITEYTREKLINSLNEDSELEYPLGLNINTFLTPQEITNKKLIKDKYDLDWFNDLEFKSKGFAIPNNRIVNFKKTIGWNDVLEFNPDNIRKAILRANKQFANDILINTNFIDLANTPYEKKKSNKSFKGITTYIIQGRQKFDNIPNIYISIGNNRSKQIFSIRDGYIELDQNDSIDNIKKNYKWAYINTFFIPLSKEDYDKFIKNLSDRDLMWFINNNNFITKFKNLYPNEKIRIINNKLFIINLLSIYMTILNANSDTSDEDLKIMLDSKPVNPIYIYILFKGNKDGFDNEFIFNKLESLINLNIDPNLDPFLEGYCSIKEFNSLLNENSILNNDFDYLDRIDYNKLYN